jgi:hypothetical protein
MDELLLFHSRKHIMARKTVINQIPLLFCFLSFFNFVGDRN